MYIHTCSAFFHLSPQREEKVKKKLFCLFVFYVFDPEDKPLKASLRFPKNLFFLSSFFFPLISLRLKREGKRKGNENCLSTEGNFDRIRIREKSSFLCLAYLTIQLQKEDCFPPFSLLDVVEHLSWISVCCISTYRLVQWCIALTDTSATFIIDSFMGSPVHVTFFTNTTDIFAILSQRGTPL